MVAVADIPPPMLDPAPAPEPAEIHPYAPSPTEEPVETNETHTASPTEPEVQLTVLETLSDSTTGPDQELFTGSANSPEVETYPISCPNDVFNRLQPIMVPMPIQRSSPQICVMTLVQGYLKHQREAGHLFIYLAEGADRASSQTDTCQSTDYEGYQLTRHRLNHLYGCSR